MTRSSLKVGVAGRGQRPETRKIAKARQFQAHKIRLREAMLTAYGRVCRICGSAERLEVDHVDGGGNAHRRSLGRWGSRFHEWLQRQGFPAGYQILCRQCHAKKTSAENRR